ncbi:MAG: hypothetical protein H7Y00_01405 [Fimbriimonadaceae bacterium]|nr:hypothetical protein [Chitinophagales bacterium]
MKFRELYLILLSITLIIYSCKENELPIIENTNTDTTSHSLIYDTISGNIYTDCSLDPEENYLLIFRSDFYGYSGWGSNSDSIITDSSGAFQYIFSFDPYTQTYFSIGMILPADSIFMLPVAVSYEPFHFATEYVRNDTIDMVIKIKVNNAHSSDDTLYYSNISDGDAEYILGPFSDTTFLAFHFPVKDLFYHSFINSMAFAWGIGYDEYIHSYNSSSDDQKVFLSLEDCSPADTVKVLIN